jgi:hypothetical protein
MRRMFLPGLIDTQHIAVFTPTDRPIKPGAEPIGLIVYNLAHANPLDGRVIDGGRPWTANVKTI